MEAKALLPAQKKRGESVVEDDGMEHLSLV